MLITIFPFCSHLSEELLRKIGFINLVLIFFLIYSVTQILPGFEGTIIQKESVIRAFFLELIFVWLIFINYFVIYYEKAKNLQIFFVVILYLTSIIGILIPYSI